jgi:hypothetical protein
VILLLKFLLVPILIAVVTLAGRRWGAAVAGWLSAFPVVAGPILLFLTVGQGRSFAAASAVGTLSAVLAILAFGIGYAWSATRLAWIWSLGVAFATYGVAVGVLVWWAPSLRVALPTVLLALVLAPCFYPPQAPIAVTPAHPRHDLWLRMAIGAALVIGVTRGAALLGPSMSGLLAMFPVMGSVLAAFSHRFYGAHFTIELLRGMVLGYYAFAAFCAVLAWMLPIAGTATAFSASLAAAAIVHMLSLRRMRRPAARTLSDAVR